jgi:hypothetical protein
LEAHINAVIHTNAQFDQAEGYSFCDGLQPQPQIQAARLFPCDLARDTQLQFGLFLIDLQFDRVFEGYL